MGKVKYALMFIGGLAVGIGYCGGNVASYVLKDEDFSNCVKYKIRKKVDKTMSKILPVLYKNENSNSFVSTYTNPRTNSTSITFKVRNAAEEFKNTIEDLIDTYGVLTRADIYELLGLQSNYFDDRWGWFDSKNIRIQRVYNGFEVILPRAFPIK